MANNLLFAVTYQIHLPNSNPSAPSPDVCNAPVEVAVVAAAGDQATLSAVINANITMNPGEVCDILQVEQIPFGDKPLYQ